MDEYSQAKSPGTRKIARWIENFICRASSNDKQWVVGNRSDGQGGKVTLAMHVGNDRRAHVCPFVRDSLDLNLFWIEESNLGHQDVREIAILLLSQIPAFKNTLPAYDPVIRGKPAPDPIGLKTYLTYFPWFGHISGVNPIIDGLHKRLKPIFVRHGLMIGQFYYGCKPGGKSCIYNPDFPALTAPVPAFAIRYMAKHDHLFLGKTHPVYLKYFPAGP